MGAPKVNHWLLQIHRELKHDVDQVPPGWKTRSQLQKEIGCGATLVKRMVRRGIDAGRIERKAFRIVTPNGLMTLFHYRQIVNPPARDARGR